MGKTHPAPLLFLKPEQSEGESKKSEEKEAIVCASSYNLWNHRIMNYEMIRILQQFKTEIVSLSFVSIFFLPICGFLFGCGCHFLWSGGLTHCNIHNPLPPNCPWCTGPLVLQMIPFLLVCLATYAGIRITRHFKKANFLRDLAGGLLCGLVTALLLALIYKNM